MCLRSFQERNVASLNRGFVFSRRKKLTIPPTHQVFYPILIVSKQHDYETPIAISLDSETIHRGFDEATQ